MGSTTQFRTEQHPYAIPRYTGLETVSSELPRSHFWYRRSKQKKWIQPSWVTSHPPRLKSLGHNQHIVVSHPISDLKAFDPGEIEQDNYRFVCIYWTLKNEREMTLKSYESAKTILGLESENTLKLLSDRFNWSGTSKIVNRCSVSVLTPVVLSVLWFMICCLQWIHQFHTNHII